MANMQVHSTIYDSKILNLRTTKPWFELILDLLFSVFDKVSKPKLSRFTAQIDSSCSLQNAIFREAIIVQKRKEQAIYCLRATGRRQGGLFVYQITLKAYRMP